MRILLVLLTYGLAILLSTAIAQDTLQFSSNNRQNVMIELFTSQGCSSCPPAERWLNTYVDNTKLWNEVIPIAFHVDYWDKLGWPDPYANHAYSMRQYRHQQQRHIRSVYTPGVVVNGQEWRGWIRGEDFPEPKPNTDAGILSFVANAKQLEVTYSRVTKDHVLNVVLLGVGITTQVERGENQGKLLEQDFVALSHEMYSAGKSNASGQWSIPLPKDSANYAKRYALAIWVSDMDDIAPIQSTGYWIPTEWITQ